MKRIVCLCMVSAILWSPISTVETPIKEGKVYSNKKSYINVSPIFGGHIKADGTEEAIDLRPQGVEKYYEQKLAQGISVQTHLNDRFQKEVSADIELKTMEVFSKESFVGVMNNNTGELIMLTRSSMSYPKAIKTKKIPILKDRFADFLFEPGALLFPLLSALMIDKNDIKERMKEQEIATNVLDVISLLTSYELHTGLNMLGFGKPSGIDLPYDNAGNVMSLNALKDETNRMMQLSGRGMQVTFMQMLKAYSIFSTRGLLLTPHIASEMIEGNSTKKFSFPVTRILSKETAQKAKYTLIQMAKRRNDLLMMDHIDIGGAYSTSDLPTNGNITRESYSAYFGFAEDLLGQSYTIGVFLIHKKDKKKHSPIPIFNLVLEEMFNENLFRIREEYLTNTAMSPMPTGEIVEYFSEQEERVPECLENTKRGISLDCHYTTYRAPEDGAFVHTVLDGKVTFVGSHKKYEKVVIVRHENKLDTMYANLDYVRPTIKKGVALKKGYRVGSVKETLMFQLIKDGERVDSLDLLSGEI